MRTWRDAAKKVIEQVHQSLPDKATEKDVKAALTAAYPFGDREMYPYKVWCQEAKRYRDNRFRPVAPAPQKPRTKAKVYGTAPTPDIDGKNFWFSEYCIRPRTFGSPRRLWVCIAEMPEGLREECKNREMTGASGIWGKDWKALTNSHIGELPQWHTDACYNDLDTAIGAAELLQLEKCVPVDEIYVMPLKGKHTTILRAQERMQF